MAYNHGKEERKWRIWKEAEEKTMSDCGIGQLAHQIKKRCFGGLI